MPVFRVVALLLLLSAAISFGLFAITGQAKCKAYGLRILKATVLTGLLFFGVLTLTRML